MSEDEGEIVPSKNGDYPLWLEFPVRMSGYWKGLLSLYRLELAKVVRRETPHGASVLEYGCGPGVNLFIWYLTMPDVRLLGVDVDKTSLDVAAQALPADPRATLVHSKGWVCPIGAHTVVSCYTLGYFDANHLAEWFKYLPGTARTLIICEPIFNGDYGSKCDPSPIYSHDYEPLCRKMGFEYEQLPLFDPKHPELARIIVARRSV